MGSCLIRKLTAVAFAVAVSIDADVVVVAVVVVVVVDVRIVAALVVEFFFSFSFFSFTVDVGTRQKLLCRQPRPKSRPVEFRRIGVRRSPLLRRVRPPFARRSTHWEYTTWVGRIVADDVVGGADAAAAGAGAAPLH